MISTITGLGDRMLAALLPKTSATACAGPECWTEYTCNCRHRTCCLTWQNKFCCGSWQGLCCV